MWLHSKLLPITALAIALIAAGCASNSKTQGEKDALFETRQINELVYSPSDWPQALAGDIVRPDNQNTYPAVVMIHGGGWTRRTRADMESLAQTVAKHGFVVFNISYRLAPEHKFPAQVHDVQLAIKWLRDNADEFGVEPSKLAAWGYSSGAHLAAMAGVISDGDDLDNPHGGELTRLQAVVAGGIPADLRKYQDSKLVNQFLGAKQADAPEIYATASPVTHVSSDDPPVYLYTGKLDFVTPLEHATEFKAALDAADVEAVLYAHSFRAHLSMFFAGGESVPQGIEFLREKLN